ncbi:DedA family protein [Geopsychrobacter electrodiphilus]|uniref:DedA family protein n=1 Tax=Geopsychrobacter electrodiphilus TaxID=225196 RepID=UPI00037CFAD0|nr:DedA family protein [Geopsychrobacter electrodiphilus]
MDAWLQQIVVHLPHGTTYLIIVALIAFLESIPLIGLAMPGSTLIVLAGFLSAHDKGQFLAICLYSAGGAFAGDLLSYGMGQKLGHRRMTTPWLARQEKKLLASQKFLAVHGGKSLLYARFLGPIRGTIPFLAGMSKMKRAFFIRVSLCSALLWGLAYPGLGYLGGESWRQAEDFTGRFGLLILLGLGASLFHLWLKRKVK